MIRESEGSQIRKRKLQRRKSEVKVITNNNNELKMNNNNENMYDDKNIEISLTLTPQHFAILVIVRCYSAVAHSNKEIDRWICKIPLLVLLYEGIIEGIIDYDYAPVCTFVNGTYLNLNISQQGNSDIDDLIECELMNGLKVTSRQSSAVTAYQISHKGEKYLKQLLNNDENVQKLYHEIQNLLYCNQCSKLKSLLRVKWCSEEQYFILKCDNNSTHHKRISRIHESEDVSYVCSPYLPKILLSNVELMKNFINNNSRIAETSLGQNNIRDELEELISLSNVKIMLTEWIPFGSNQIYGLNVKLGSTQRLKGGLFLSTLDNEPKDSFECCSGLTSVKVVDYDVDEYIAFQAEIKYAEQAGIIQIETIGIHCSEIGSVNYGFSINSIMDNCEDVSLDHLARVISDIREDSSEIMHNLLSSYQLSLLDTLFLGSAKKRAKVRCIIAESIKDVMNDDNNDSNTYKTSHFYDSGAYENEMKQVLGDTENAFQISDDIMLFLGTSGLLLIGPDTQQYEPLLVTYITLKAMKTFHQFFYQRVIFTHETLKKIRALIDKHAEDPNSIKRIRHLHSTTENDVILLQEILNFLLESLEHIQTDLIKFDNNIDGTNQNTTAEEKLKLALNIPKEFKAIKRRVIDMNKNIVSAKHELNCLIYSISNIESWKMMALTQEIADNTKNVENVFKSNERASNSLELLEIILSGTLAFDILDRLTGEWSVVDQIWAKPIIEILLSIPLLWFLINISLWVIIGYGLTKFMRYLGEKAEQVLVISLKMNTKINIDKMNTFLKTRDVHEESSEMTTEIGVRKIHWAEDDDEIWCGTPPEVDLHYDFIHGYLLHMILTFNKMPNMQSEEKLKKIMLQKLNDVFDEELSNYWSKSSN